ncbi:hypothetical protein EYC84_008350 [Monilinia fructicola]|uniref:Uncharacterized protein n=1 Tax=Monilinia fructicola TaxID=38448 RepID=A0A5M9JEU6_MONFR|nr:hypothetical protein EYC84_008350 [Monilinia fructicola]
MERKKGNAYYIDVGKWPCFALVDILLPPFAVILPASVTPPTFTPLTHVPRPLTRNSSLQPANELINIQLLPQIQHPPSSASQLPQNYHALYSRPYSNTLPNNKR